VVWKAKYSSFGKATVESVSTVVNPLRFPGQYEDAETGLLYNYYRYYDLSIGKYIRIDPLSLSKIILFNQFTQGALLKLYPQPFEDEIFENYILSAALFGQVTENSQLLNVYNYAISSPINVYDPEGEFGVVGAGIGAASDLAWQLFIEGKSFECVDWKSVVISGALGAIGGQGFKWFKTGKEFVVRTRKFGKMRFAPFGNRTGHKYGRWPHYHRAKPNPYKPGESLPGQGMKRHRPWETKSPDTSFRDRF
jgi:RHS repeat-associated protein